MRALRSVILPSLLIAGLFAACNTSAPKQNNGQDTTVAAKVDAANDTVFNTTIDNRQVHLFTLQNSSGAKATITNYGGRLVSLLVPDKQGNPTDVVAGFSSVAGYQHSTEPYFGATIGRYGNRIAKGKFTLDGKQYTLFTNNGQNTLHGGKTGFQHQNWRLEKLNDSTLVCKLKSPDGDNGFAGNLSAKVIYSLSGNGLVMEYEAISDKPTVVNLTNHAFFNLNSESSGSILNHLVQIDADRYTPVDSTLIPTGKLDPVKGTPFDFTTAKTIGERIEAKDEQLKNGKGYDHNYVLNKHAANQTVATITGDKSGIVMTVTTDQPGLQFYSGNFMQSKNTMKGGHKDEFRTAFALETQHFPDSPNQLSFPSTVLKPGDTYRTSSTYKFSLKKIR